VSVEVNFTGKRRKSNLCPDPEAGAWPRGKGEGKNYREASKWVFWAERKRAVIKQGKDLN